jgi:hypothetical protein
MEIITLNTYLEMITSERLRKEGLTPHKSKLKEKFPIPIGILGPITNYDNMKKDYETGVINYDDYNTYLNSFLRLVNDIQIINGISFNFINRVVIFNNSLIYSSDVYDSVHDYLIGKAIYDKKITIPENIFINWNKSTNSFPYFICLQQSRYDYTKFYLSESYYDNVAKESKKHPMFKKYQAILKSVEGDFKIIPECSKD